MDKGAWWNSVDEVAKSRIPLSDFTFTFKKLKDTKRTFHAKMGTIKDRNDMNLTEAEDKLKMD